ncbi:hypothetical protein BHM03_00061021 [Ensete ventricosum]|nr:hypothetical protein BHM03_00061021 [Ensete ventricosum]
MGSRTSTLSQKNTTVINFTRNRARVEFRSVFRAPSRKFKILALHDVLAQGKLYEHGFTKKRNGHKLYAELSFDRFFVHRLENSKYWSLPRVEFLSLYLAPSQKFKVLAIPYVLAFSKSYEHGFAKKCDGHKLCAKLHADSSFYRFFVHRLGNSKYWPFPTY